MCVCVCVVWCGVVWCGAVCGASVWCVWCVWCMYGVRVCARVRACVAASVCILRTLHSQRLQQSFEVFVKVGSLCSC